MKNLLKELSKELKNMEFSNLYGNTTTIEKATVYGETIKLKLDIRVRGYNFSPVLNKFNKDKKIKLTRQSDNGNTHGEFDRITLGFSKSMRAKVLKGLK